MVIQSQQTPNPNALKFMLPQKYFEQPLSFSSAEKAADHPLAHRLFALGDVYNVFMVQDFITVNKMPDADWDALTTLIQSIIAEHFGL